MGAERFQFPASFSSAPEKEPPQRTAGFDDPRWFVLQGTNAVRMAGSGFFGLGDPTGVSDKVRFL